MSIEKIAAGIVLFNPDIQRLKKNVEAIIPQVELLLMVDNHSDNIKSIEDSFQKDRRIILLKNPENFGIAKALNQMCAAAINEGFSWILTLDQDTICPIGTIDKFLLHTQDAKNVIICPQFSIQGQNLKLVDPNKVPSESIELCITSASLTRLKTWEALEGFNEWLFIDGVDYDYCIRARRLGGCIIRVNNVIIDHQVGVSQVVRLPFGFVVRIYNHSAFRNYYIVRNNIFLLKNYWKDLHGFSWVIKFFHFELVKLVFEQNRIKMMISMFRGIRDGLFDSPDSE